MFNNSVLNKEYFSKYDIFTGETTAQVEFTGETTERPRMIRRNTWTKLEGDLIIETTSKSEFKQYDQVDRSELVTKRIDNLTIGEGTIEVRFSTFSAKEKILPQKFLNLIYCL